MDGPVRSLCVVVPCFDEEQAVEHTYVELKRELARLPDYRALIYFVDDGSQDGTLARLNELARHDRGLVPEVARQGQHAHRAVLARQLVEPHQGAILATVVDEVDQRAVVGQRGELTLQRGVGVLDGLLLIEARHHDTQQPRGGRLHPSAHLYARVPVRAHNHRWPPVTTWGSAGH